MADDSVDDDDQPGEIDEEDLEGLGEEDLIDDEEADLADDDEESFDDDEEGGGDEEDDEEGSAASAKKSAEDDDEDELEVDHDVEATLDEILKERLVVVEEDDEEDDEPADRADEGDSGKVAPKRPDEFVCQSCFLVKHPSQLADPKRQFCRDCV
ncbi:MAG TPA: DUF4193 family protein [Acidimicrobiales bacterium]|nr:DUF4193 family protein [Acidimicrobiales bacterium]